MNVKGIAETLTQAAIPYALLDEEDSMIRILISEDKMESFKKTAAKSGWKQIKDKSKDLYLYGMKHFMYFMVNGETLIICFQLACRSTLNNGWVPLDRQINEQALMNVTQKEHLYYLSTEDELCYLAAKCVYTEKKFGKSDIGRIEACMSMINRERLMPKLEGVFFRFTEHLLQLLERKEYDDIIPSLWKYAAY